MISISLDGRKIQKSGFLAIVNLNGKHLRQIKMINTVFNSAYRSSIVETAFWQVAGEEWIAKVRKENGGCISCNYDRVGVAGRLPVFFYPVKGIWLIIKGSLYG